MKKGFQIATVAMAVSLFAVGGIFTANAVLSGKQPAEAQVVYRETDGVAYLGVRDKSRKDMLFLAEQHVVKEEYEGKEYVKELEIIITYRWERSPVSFKYDAIKVWWNQDLFVFKSDSFYSCDTRISERKPLIGKSTFYEEKHERTCPMGLEMDNLTYQVDLSSKYAKNRKLTTKEASGYARFTLIPQQSPMFVADDNSLTNFLSIVNAEYLHTRNPFWRFYSEPDPNSIFTDTAGVRLLAKFTYN